MKFKINNKLNTILIISLIILLSLVFFVHIYKIDSFMTHIDDISVASFILNPESFFNQFNSTLHDKDFFRYNSSMYQISRNIVDTHPKLVLSVYPFVSLFLSTTYAPFQFIFTNLLLNFYHGSYEQILFFGRLPSLIFSMLAILSLILLFYLLDKKNYLSLSLIGVTFMGFSLEFITYSKQMHNYTIGVFSAIIILLLIFFFFSKEDKTFKDYFIYALILSLLTYFQYHTILFIVPFFILILIYDYNLFNNLRKKNFKFILSYDLFKKYFIFFSTFLLCSLLSILSMARFKSGVNMGWNGGINREFIFSFTNQTLIGKIVYTFKFFISNFFEVFSIHLNPFLPENSLHLIFSLILLPLFIIGLINLYYSKNKIFRIIFFYYIIFAIFFSFLVITKKFTFSPTRHTLSFLPLFVLASAIGLISILDIIKNKVTLFRNKELFQISSIILIIIIISSLFFINFFSFINQRQDLFNENELLELVDNYNVSTIVCFSAMNPAIMPNLKNKTNIYVYATWIKSRDKIDYDKIIFINEIYPIDETLFNITTKKDGGFGKFSDYTIIYRNETIRKIQIDITNKTYMGDTGRYIYILEKS